MGFNWNEVYTTIKYKIEKSVSGCTVGRYANPKESQFPYVDIELSDISGNDYDLSGVEGTQTPMLTISVYSIGESADTECESIASVVKNIMTSYGFTCKRGPLKVPNVADQSIARWVGRYERVFGNGDALAKLN